MHEINSSNNTEWGRDPIAYSSGSKGVQMLFRAPLLQTPRALLTFTPNIVDPQLPLSREKLGSKFGAISRAQSYFQNPLTSFGSSHDWAKIRPRIFLRCGTNMSLRYQYPILNPQVATK